MPSFEVRCGFCGTVFEAADETAGQAVTCPGCQRQVSVPVPVEPGVERPRLAVKKDAAPGGMPVCPSCGGVMPENAVLCVKCGHDMRTGTRYQPRAAAANLLRLLTTGIGIVILAGLARTYLRRRAEQEAPPVPATAGKPEAAEPADGLPAEEPQAPPAPADASIVEAPPAGVTQEVAASAAPAPVEAAATPASSAQADEAMMRTYEEGLQRWLAQRYPPYVSGDEAVLRRANGRVHRGKVFEIGVDRVSLLTDGAREEIPFALLDHGSRLRCDKAYRLRWVDFQVKRRAGAAGNL